MELLKNAVCKGSHDSCARLMVASTLGRQCVAADLYPSDTEWARSIIEKNKG